MSTIPTKNIDERRVYLTAFLVFALAAAVTTSFVRSMSGGMAMPGGWTMSMMWMRMPGEGRTQAAAVFLGMWVAMMIAMMLPSTLPMLLLYRRTMRFRQQAHPEVLTSIVGAGYFVVWTAFGAVVYILGIGLSELSMMSRAVSHAIPALSGASLMLAGFYQLTPWKAACLHHCRDPLSTLVHLQKHWSRRPWVGALRLGLLHGAFCAGCCWGLMLIQLTLGVMSLTAMIAVASVIAFEKLVARGMWVARVAGIAAIGGGLIIVGRTL